MVSDAANCHSGAGPQENYIFYVASSFPLWLIFILYGNDLRSYCKPWIHIIGAELYTFITPHLYFRILFLCVNYLDSIVYVTHIIHIIWLTYFVETIPTVVLILVICLVMINTLSLLILIIEGSYSVLLNTHSWYYLYRFSFENECS